VKHDRVASLNQIWWQNSGQVNDFVCYDDAGRAPKDLPLWILVLRRTLGFYGQETIRPELLYWNRWAWKGKLYIICYLVRQETMYVYHGFVLLQGYVVHLS
jgi:hypothetical protein